MFLRQPRYVGLVCFSLLAVSIPVLAQCPGSSVEEVAASPSQPTITDSPDTIAPGITEVELGWGRTWPGGGASSSSVGGLTKFGLVCNVEIRNYYGGWQSQTDPSGAHASGAGDDWVSGQYRFHRESKYLPVAAVHYSLKIPLANSDKGLGSGQFDHIFAASGGKNVGKYLFNFESKWILPGQPRNAGLTRYEEYSANVSRSLTNHWSILAELYGDTQAGPGSPAFASNLWTVSYSVNPRLICDTGVDVGITNGAPQKRIFAGITYAVGDFYRVLRQHRAVVAE